MTDNNIMDFDGVIKSQRTQRDCLPGLLGPAVSSLRRKKKETLSVPVQLKEKRKEKGQKEKKKEKSPEKKFFLILPDRITDCFNGTLDRQRKSLTNCGAAQFKRLFYLFGIQSQVIILIITALTIYVKETETNIIKNFN